MHLEALQKDVANSSKSRVAGLQRVRLDSSFLSWRANFSEFAGGHLTSSATFGEPAGHLPYPCADTVEVFECQAISVLACEVRGFRSKVGSGHDHACTGAGHLSDAIHRADRFRSDEAIGGVFLSVNGILNVTEVRSKDGPDVNSSVPRERSVFDLIPKLL